MAAWLAGRALFEQQAGQLVCGRIRSKGRPGPRLRAIRMASSGSSRAREPRRPAPAAGGRPGPPDRAAARAYRRRAPGRRARCSERERSTAASAVRPSAPPPQARGPSPGRGRTSGRSRAPRTRRRTMRGGPSIISSIWARRRIERRAASLIASSPTASSDSSCSGATGGSCSTDRAEGQAAGEVEPLIRSGRCGASSTSSELGHGPSARRRPPSRPGPWRWSAGPRPPPRA